MKAAKKRLSVKQIVDTLRSRMGIVSLTCQDLGVSRTTFYRWYNDPKNERLRRKIDEVGEMQIDITEHYLLANIRKGKERSIMYYLDAKGGSRGYGKKAVSENPESSPLQITVLNDKVKEQIESLKND